MIILFKMIRKIPVFYHIPKNAGTYVSDWLMIAFRSHWNTLINIEQATWWRGKLRDLGFKTEKEYVDSMIKKRDSIKCLHIIQKGFTVAKFLAENPNYFCEDYPFFIKKYSNTEWEIELQHITPQLLENIRLFAVVVEARGFLIKQQLLNLLDQYSFHQFLILRDPFSRLQSLYNYLTTNTSKHEKTHGLITNSTFEDYVLSETFEDNWLTRNLLSLSDFNEQLNKNHFEKVIETLNQFYVYNIKNTNKAIQDAILNCYGFDVYKIDLNSWDVVTKNNSNHKKIQFKDLSLKAQEVFMQKTYWDNKIYEAFLI